MNKRRIRIDNVFLVLKIRGLRAIHVIATISVLGPLTDASTKLPETKGD